MYPNRSRYFLDKFEKATNKEHGKLILVLRMVKYRFMEDGQCPEEFSSPNESSLTPSMTEMYSRQLEQQRNAL